MKKDQIGNMKTPLQELIERLSDLYDANPMEPDYQAGLSDAINQARLLLPIERSHLKAAWRDGGESILNQTAEEYLIDAYGS